MHTFRSAVESYQDCPRLRYNQFHYNGIGLVKVAKSVPLVTGTVVHKGVEVIGRAIIQGKPIDIDDAVMAAVEQYVRECESVGFTGKGMENDRQQSFTFREQKALAEALIRVWALIELPNILNRYKILAVEREIEPLNIIEDIKFLARVDMELQELNSGDYYNYSLKTIKTWGEKQDDSYRDDLQSLTEMWAVEQDSLRTNEAVRDICTHLEFLKLASKIPSNNADKIIEYLSKNFLPSKKIMGTRFCFLIKGARKKPDYSEDSLYITYNPLIRGYKYISPDGIQYAHSWRYRNLENKSGFSTLGRGWTPFNVWESDISIKDWIYNLSQGNIQPEAGNAIGQAIITPAEYFRDELELDIAIREIQAQERYILQGLQILDTEDDVVELIDAMAQFFPHRRQRCQWIFGDRCPYYEMCWQPEVSRDPIESGLYEIRKPHHSTEEIK